LSLGLSSNIFPVSLISFNKYFSFTLLFPMFHVEHFMKILAFALFLFFSGCTKTDPHPETSDEIYQDLGQELDIATKALEGAQKNLELAKEEVKKAIPQTGQIKYATKKLRNAEAYLAEMNQRKIYFDVKRERRKNYVQFRYQESLKSGGRPWPDKNEIDEYKAVVKFNRQKLEWDRNKGMKKDVPRGTKSSPAGESPEGGESAEPEHH
jgi:hypothetical protein